MDRDGQKYAYNEFLKLSQEIKDLDSASKLSEFKTWMAEHENDIKLSGIGKALNNVVITESNIDEILGKCSEMAEKKGAKLQKAVKKKLKKAKKTENQKRKRNKEKLTNKRQIRQRKLLIIKSYTQGQEKRLRLRQKASVNLVQGEKQDLVMLLKVRMKWSHSRVFLKEIGAMFS